MVDTPPTKWADLWDEKYADNILMMDSIKDSFMAVSYTHLLPPYPPWYSHAF